METSFDKVFPPCSGNFGRCRHAKRLTRQKLGGGYDRYNPERCSVGFYEVDTMFRSRMAEAALIGCLAALASFCALSARAGETYSIVAQSSRSSATTGRRPLAERISAANLPIITARPAPEPAAAIARVETEVSRENMAVAAVQVDHRAEAAPAPAPKPAVTPPVLWPFGTKWPGVTTAQKAAKPTPKIVAANGPKPAAASGQKPESASQRQASASSSGKGLSSSSPASVTR